MSSHRMGIELMMLHAYPEADGTRAVTDKAENNNEREVRLGIKPWPGIIVPAGYGSNERRMR